MKTKHQKILVAIFTTPTRANIKFADIESLLVSLGGLVKEGAGSRMSVNISGKTIFFHRPHPGKEAKKYQVENAREFLQRIGVEP
ncbi:MAG: type II toxin-antitoxin system HicA family toxin [Spirochaetales bacterium]|nr:type II toxin-antitoxin system HicA family toxin [Spirochaetales bacterium]